MNQDASEELDTQWTRPGQRDKIQDSSSSDEEMDRVTADLPVQNSDKDSQEETVARLIKCVEEKVCKCIGSKRKKVEGGRTIFAIKTSV